MATFKEFWETWIGEVERIQETLTGLKEKVNMQEVELKDLELDVGSMLEKIRRLDQVDGANRASAT